MAGSWSTEKVKELIDFYEDKPCLYNVKHKDYHNRDERSKALTEISALTGFSGEITSADSILCY
jgi:hypothetical protein